MKGCDYDGACDDKPMPKKGAGGQGVADKPKMSKGGGKGPSGGKTAGGGVRSGEKMGHIVHHQHMPHGHKGPSNPEGY